MSDEPKRSRGHIYAAVVLVIVIFYPLSAGPLLWMHANGYISQPTADLLITTVYFPLAWCVENSYTVRGLWQPFEDFWRGM